MSKIKPKPPMICRVCVVPLSLENCEPSMFIRNGTAGRICKPCLRIDRKEKYLTKRIKIMELLGNKCGCCGETAYEKLSIDHIFGGGHQQKKTRRGKSYLAYLLDLPNLTDLYQCLCFNCNYTKGFYGACPHQFQKKS